MDFSIALIILASAERAKPFIVDKTLTQYAAIRAEQACTEWNHNKFRSLFNSSPSRYRYGGENLVKDFYSASEAHKALMASPTHKENILKLEYKRIGVAKARSCNAYAEWFSN